MTSFRYVVPCPFTLLYLLSTAENVAKPNALIVNGENNVNRDLSCNERLVESLRSDLNF